MPPRRRWPSTARCSRSAPTAASPPIYLGAAARAAAPCSSPSTTTAARRRTSRAGSGTSPTSSIPAVGQIDTLPFFRRTIHDAGLEGTVVAVVADSPDARRHWTTPLALLFIDGGHGTEPAHRDYEQWTPHVAPGGCSCIHDVFPDPADGGRPPYEIYCRALDSGEVRRAQRHRLPARPPPADQSRRTSERTLRNSRRSHPTFAGMRESVAVEGGFAGVEQLREHASRDRRRGLTRETRRRSRPRQHDRCGGVGRTLAAGEARLVREHRAGPVAAVVVAELLRSRRTGPRRCPAGRPPGGPARTRTSRPR